MFSRFPLQPAHNAAMRKRVQIVLAVLLMAVAGVIAWQVLHSQEAEPVYQGKGLRVWLREYDRNWNAYDEEAVKSRNMAEGAVRQIGTNSIPNLLRMLSKKDSPAVAKLVDLWNRRINSFPVWLRYPGWYENQAAFQNTDAAAGFEILGAEAQQAVPALTRIYEQNISPSSQRATARALIAIGPMAGTTIPSFLRMVTNSSADARFTAVYALSQVHAEARLAVPALTESLKDTDYLVRLFAARGLGDYGTNAQQAVPALVLLLSDPHRHVRPMATNALKKIDPEAAAEAGVK